MSNNDAQTASKMKFKVKREQVITEISPGKHVTLMFFFMLREVLVLGM